MYSVSINADQTSSNVGAESYAYIGVENANKVYGKIEEKNNKIKELEKSQKKVNAELQKEVDLLKDNNAKLSIQANKTNDEKEQIERLYEDAQVLFKVKNDESSVNYDLLLILLSITALASITVSFWLYRWRRVVTAGNMPVVPETFAQQVNDIVSAVKNSNDELGNNINQQSTTLNQSNSSLLSLSEDIKTMIEVHMKLQSALDQKENEINRHKEGYDAKIFHKFLLRFTRVDQVFKDYIGDDEIDKDVRDALEDIGEVMEDALAECGVETFSPEIGGDYRIVEGVADNPKKFDTDNEGKHFLIKEVLDEGYRRETSDGNYKIITEAKVSIYVYKKPE